MQGIEQRYCDVCIGAVVMAYRSLFEASVAEALNKTRYGKSDTYGFDAIPEIVIQDRLRGFDDHGILVTEELDEAARRRWPTEADRMRQPLMFFSDPTDRSSQLHRFLQQLTPADNQLIRIGNLMGRKKCVSAWEGMFEAPATITGATSSITCVRKGSVIFSVIVNFITQTIIVATADGIFQLRLPSFSDHKLSRVDLAHIIRHGRTLTFTLANETCHNADDFLKFVTFLGKSGYRECFNDSMIFVKNPDDFLHHTEPGGPSRVLYLSELQKGHGSIGFIMANGEKIGEWIHWLAFAKFARTQEGGQKLRVFEVSIERPWTKDGVLMSTSPPYSIFSNDGQETYLDVSRLRNFDMPSRFRSMLVITQSDNDRVVNIMRRHNYREIDLTF